MAFPIDPVFLAWIAGLALFIFIFRKNVEIQFPIFLLKSKSLGELIYKKSRKLERVIGPLADFGVLVGFVGMVFVVYFLGKSLWQVLQPNGIGSVSIIIPGVRVPGSPVFLPFTYGIISIALLAIVHELAHAIVASCHGVKPKSVALALFLFIPAAGVEIDERKLARRPLRTKLRIFAAGSFANFLTALLVLGLAGLVAFAAKPHFTPAGTEILTVAQGAPAEGMLLPGDVVTAINGRSVLNLSDFVSVAGELKPGDSLEIEKVGGTRVTVVAGPREEDPTKGRLGITTRQSVSFDSVGKILLWLLGLFNWVFSLNIGVGIINLFPFPLMDGGRMFADVTKHYFGKERGNLVNKVAFFISAPLLAFNILIPIVKAVFFK
ncbi:MAG: site-2 protease family protein [archaeon]